MMHARVSVTGTRQQTADASLRLNTMSGQQIQSGTRWCNVLLIGS